MKELAQFLFMAAAVIISLYQGWRGFMMQWYYCCDQNSPKVRRVLLFCLADGFTYLLCASSGFVSLIVFLQLVHNGFTADRDQSILLIFLLLYGIAGITGKLPDILGKLKLGG